MVLKERELVKQLLRDAPVGNQQQFDNLRVVGRCGCGECPTIVFQIHQQYDAETVLVMAQRRAKASCWVPESASSMNFRSHHIYGVRLDNTGWFAFIDKQGVDIDVAVVQRLVTHARNKGPKVRTKQALSGKRLSADGPQELCAYHDVFVIGTSYSFLPA